MCIYSNNITHNLTDMADAAGIYKAVWSPDEIGIATARQLIDPLRNGFALLRSDPDRFREFNPKNGWGDYDGLVRFVAEYIAACEEFPDAKIEVSR